MRHGTPGGVIPVGEIWLEQRHMRNALTARALANTTGCRSINDGESGRRSSMTSTKGKISVAL